MSRLHLLLFLLSIIHFAQGQKDDGLKSINGTKLYIKSVGQGEPILVVHGGPGMNHAYFIPHLDRLSKDHQIIYYDQRASGKSVIPWIDSISLNFFVDDIEAIRKHFKLEQLSILAHSWGAIPAVGYGLKYQDRVKNLILCNAVPLSKEFDIEMKEMGLLRTSGLDSTDRSIIKGSPNFKAGKPSAYRKLMLLSFRNSFHHAANLKKLNVEIAANYKPASSALLFGLGQDLKDYNYYDQLAQFKFPVLILRGQHDLVPLSADQLAMDKIPYATMEVFRKSGHFIFIEENKKFTSVVNKFLEH